MGLFDAKNLKMFYKTLPKIVTECLRDVKQLPIFQYGGHLVRMYLLINKPHFFENKHVFF